MRGSAMYKCLALAALVMAPSSYLYAQGLPSMSAADPPIRMTPREPQPTPTPQVYQAPPPNTLYQRQESIVVPVRPLNFTPAPAPAPAPAPRRSSPNR